MANLYGVANAPGLPVTMNLFNGADIALTTTGGAWTPIGSSPALIAPSNGYFYCRVDFAAQIASGAAGPSGVNMAVAIGAGSFTAGLSQPGYIFAPNSTVPCVWVGFTPVSQVAWQGAGSIVTVGMNCGVNVCTCKQWSWAIFTLLRAPDQ